MHRRAQIAIFVILAIIIVGLLVAFFAFRNTVGLTSVPGELQPVFDYYTSCINDAVRTGVSLAGSQGGYVDAGDYTPGSDYAPFSSHLLFAGSQIPYWFSVSGNGLVQEHVPSKTDIEQQLDSFVRDRLSACDFSVFQQQGFEISVADQPRVEISVGDRTVSARVVNALSVARGEQRAHRETHDVQVASNLGSLYAEAVSFYKEQQTNAYLDNYAADILRLYAPVDGVLVQCNPQIWKTREVFQELQNALEANFAHVRFSSTRTSNAEQQYFTVPHSFGSDARVLYSSAWPLVFEVTPADDELMVAEPVGNQKGLGVLGFCYVPYHFVYDLRFPVLMQLTRGQDVFQFPLLVLVDKNAPRNALTSGIAADSASPDICSFREGRASIATYDTNLNPVEADIFYQCFDQRCSLGRTSLSGTTASLNVALPVCVNGQLSARAANFSETRQLFSSNNQTTADLILERLYPVTVSVYVDGKLTRDMAVVHFSRNEGSTVSALSPDQPTVSLQEGLYTISVFVYGNSTLTLPGTTKQECTEVPRGGIAGFFGTTEERCFAITTPVTKIDSALRGGGHASEIYLLASELAQGHLNVYVNGLPAPTTLEQLQTNFELFESGSVEVSFT